MSWTAGSASSGSVAPLMTYGPDGATAAVMASVPSTEAMKARKSLAASMFSAGRSAMYVAAGIQMVAPFVRRIVARLREEADVV